MSSTRASVDYVVSQMQRAGTVSARAMFGEFGIYCDGKMPALFCNDQLFVKPTPAGEAFMGAHEKAPPYPGAKPHLLIPEDRWDDGAWLSELIRLTTAALPEPIRKSSAKKPAARAPTKRSPRT
jgi:TfoX/Sxy family transcriptional regulator of competence genes